MNSSHHRIGIEQKGSCKQPTKAKAKAINYASLSLDQKIEIIIGQESQNRDSKLLKNIQDYFWQRISHHNLKDFLATFYHCFRQQENLPEELWGCVYQRLISLLSDIDIWLLTQEDINDIYRQFPDKKILKLIEKILDQRENLENQELAQVTAIS
ncbi:MAG: hypothetical protein WDA13_04155 [Candidatus Shapirobacteria bacterium]